MRSVEFLLLILGTLVYSGTVPVFQDKFYQRKLFSRSTTMAPIRIFFEYQNFDLGSTELNDEFKLKVEKFVNDFLKKSLKTLSLLDPLAVSEPFCGPLIEVPILHIDPGLQNYDFITYITSISSETSTFASYSGICDLDSTERNRVTAGYIVLNSAKFSNLSLKSKFMSILQEMTHILGFSSELYPYWKNFTGQLYEPSRLYSEFSIRETTKNVLVTENVKLRAVEAFGCSSLAGIELEDYNQAGIASYWDRRIMFNDYMTVGTSDSFIISTVTLALLKDSGWYDVDYSYAQVPVFGRASGCGFFDLKCITNGISSNPDYWCTSPNYMTCDSFYISKAFCNLASWSNLPQAFHYFAYQSFGTNTLAGSDGSADYCPYNSAYLNGNCKGSNIGAIYDERTSEVYGINSRCFKSTLIKSPDVLNVNYAACYEVLSCSPTATSIKVGDFIVSCPFTGGSITIDGYNGELYCPSSDVLCRDAPCPAACFGAGKCVNGYCDCDPGFSGDDCSIICPGNCTDCSSPQVCTVCNQGFFLDNGLCIFCVGNCSVCGSASTCSSCKTGYYLQSSVSCSKCASACTECKTLNLCTACVLGRFLTTTWTCSSCPSNCDTCSNATTCTVCKKGYFKTSANACSVCSSTCAACTSATTCIECKTGYFLNATSTCVLCSTTCSSCTSALTCQSCKPGFYLSSDYKCLACTKGCASCDIFEACKQCGQGYYYLGTTNKCGTCILGCSTCNNTSTCQICKVGYFLNSLKTCTACPSICSNCSSATVCSSCKTGYYLSGTSCIVCTSPCLACTSPTICTSCIVGYFLINSGCQPCNISCKGCTSANVCSSCNVGFYLSSGNCVACSSNCATCNSVGCLTCLTGFTLISGLCK